ncbi:hypothetical protein FFI94_020320 [Rhodococcus sp. KBS0724]|nr:hypothetical protein FFI94_020320 [Rhodococcus sp. KBS0724]
MSGWNFRAMRTARQSHIRASSLGRFIRLIKSLSRRGFLTGTAVLDELGVLSACSSESRDSFISSRGVYSRVPQGLNPKPGVALRLFCGQP